MDAQMLVHVNAVLNGVTVVFLLLGYYFIKTGNRRSHKAMMLSALAASAVFLVSYVVYKLNSGFAKFGGEGIIRPIYFTILIIHVIGAIAIVPLVPITVMRALGNRFDKHRQIAHITWPVWMFVGLSGVVVYIMAVHLFPYTGV